jgi:iron-sulfur cluster repair protein YtfE (RIC family)
MKHFIAENLARHFEAEEKFLFPVLETAVVRSRPLVSALRSEHDRIRRGVGPAENSVQLSKALFDLADLLERHIRREERELFPIFEAEVPPREAEKIKKDIEGILGSSG